MEHVRWHSQPALRSPVMIAAFTGWNDAADAASRAVRAMIEGWGAQPLATIDPEEFTDFATTRPHVRLVDGITREIVWPQVSLWWASTPGGDVILVLGPEPSMRWRTFVEQLVGVARQYESPLVITLGALLADVPHSRAVQVIGTANDASIVERFGLERSRYEGPTGIVGVLHDGCTRAGLESASLWAATPAYAAQVASPKAALALVRRAAAMVGTPAPAADLIAEIDDYESQVDSLISDDDDLPGYVRRLEEMADGAGDDDESDEDDDAGAALDPEAGGEQLIEELEQFLRDQG